VALARGLARGVYRIALGRPKKADGLRDHRPSGQRAGDIEKAGDRVHRHPLVVVGQKINF